MFNAIKTTAAMISTTDTMNVAQPTGCRRVTLGFADICGVGLGISFALTGCGFLCYAARLRL